MKIKQLEAEALYFIRQFPQSKIAVSFSGGKDSLVALHLASRAGIKKAVMSDTTIEPKETIEYAINIAEYLGIHLEILRPKKSFWELLPIFGPPSINNRWCCPTIKYPQLNEYAKRHNIKFFITGLRKKESSLRRKYKKLGVNKMLPYVIELNPLIEWEEDDIWEYIDYYDLPVLRSYSQGFSRNGCIFCPYKSDKELEKLKRSEKEEWEKFEKFLADYAEKMQIPDKNYFVRKGWKRWRPPIKRKIVAHIIRENDRIMVPSNIRQQLQETSYTNILLDPVRNIKKYKILIEKVLNCVGCGACLSLCPSSALYINKSGIIDVHEEKCIHCYSCLETHMLRGACTARNYSLEVFKIDVVTQNKNMVSTKVLID